MNFYYIMVKKKNWQKQEEKEFLKLLHLQKAYPDWKTISKSLKSLKILKSPQQCYYRWYKNKNKEPYKTKFQKQKTKFTKQEEKKLLKLSFSFAPKWKKISNHFDNRSRFDVCNHFYGIVRKSLIKACKLIGKKNSTDVLWKIKPKMYSSLIDREIRVDFGGYKRFEFEFGKNDADCPGFVFVKFFDFVWRFYFEDFGEIWEKITEREVFIVKNVIVYLIQINLSYNNRFKLGKIKFREFLKNKKFFDNFQNDIIASYGKSFNEQNRMEIEISDEKQIIKTYSQKSTINTSDDALIKLINNNFNFINELKFDEVDKNKINTNHLENFLFKNNLNLSKKNIDSHKKKNKMNISENSKKYLFIKKPI